MPICADIRPASTDDAGAIAELMRASVSETVRRITILGSPNLARFVADQIASAQGDVYRVSVLGPHVVGVCVWRVTHQRVQLNHLYVAPDVRGQGRGQKLILEGLRRHQAKPDLDLSVDVFFDNPQARTWYRSWGMGREQHLKWVQIPLPPLKPIENVRCVITGLSEANDRHSRYGFSQLSVSTPIARYPVGRLGDGLFRITSFSILHDPEALLGLARLDSQRDLLCVGPAENVAVCRLESATVVAESERLVASSAAALNHLEVSLSAQSRHLRQTSIQR